MATMNVHIGIKKYPHARIVMIVTKEATKSARYHHSGTSA
jgi:hypothetical protein